MKTELPTTLKSYVTTISVQLHLRAENYDEAKLLVEQAVSLIVPDEHALDGFNSVQDGGQKITRAAEFMPATRRVVLL